MSDTKEYMTIISDLCIGCGTCVRVCPHRMISLKNGKAFFLKMNCFMCGHCAAVCPKCAISSHESVRFLNQFSTFSTPSESLPMGKGNTEDLVHLMESRRSVRNFNENSIPYPVLEDLVRIGISAPSGSNAQACTFTILPERKNVLFLAKAIAVFYERINRMAKNFFLRKFLKIIGRPALDDYYDSHFSSVEKALSDWREIKADRLFHGATSAILVGSFPDASCPCEDAMLITQNILLAAHTMGIGSCLIGFASIAIERDKSIQQKLGINKKETIHSVIALGYPDVRYFRKCGRRSAIIRWGSAG